jgi:hypothetical protein
MNKVNFDKMMRKFAKIFEKGLEPDVLKIYLDLFEEIPDNQVDYITRECLKKCHYFPRPADIFDCLEEIVDYPKLE